MNENEIKEWQARVDALNAEKGIAALHEELKRHFEAKGVKNAFLYQPVTENYWKIEPKIAFCNIEPYDDCGGGIIPVTYDIMARWHRSKTFDGTEKFCQLINNIFEEDPSKVVTKDDVKKIDADDDYTSFEGLTDFFFYCNLRFTPSKTVRADESETLKFYDDEFYRDYFKRLLKASEAKALVVTGEIGCRAMNKIYDGLNLEFRGSKVMDGMLFFSMEHPSHISHEALAASANAFMDAYFAMKDGK